MTHRFSSMIASIGVGLLTGCWSFPKTSGTWSGTIESRTLYVGNQPVHGALLHVITGTNLDSSVKYDLFMVDSNDQIIDATEFKPNTIVRLNGNAGLAVTNVLINKPSPGDPDMYGVAMPTVEVKNITVLNGNQIHLRLARPRTAFTSPH